MFILLFNEDEPALWFDDLEEAQEAATKYGVEILEIPNEELMLPE